jgi:hypothetical protein
MERAQLTAIKKDLELLKKAVAEIKLSLDPDTLLDEDDTKSIQNYHIEKDKDSLLDHEQVKNELLSS